METRRLINIADALKFSTYIGIIVFTLNIVQLLFNPQSINNPASFWLNIKYLIWAVGVFYALRWYHFNSERKILGYFVFIAIIASFTSVFDIFFYVLYYQIINPESRETLINLIFEVNPSLKAYEVTLRDQFASNFILIYSLSLYFSYVIMFLFYSIFYVIFLKLVYKAKK